jgi:hypothetical protein
MIIPNEAIAVSALGFIGKKQAFFTKKQPHFCHFER